MKIHEYQAKELLRQYGIPIPEGIVVKTLEQVIQVPQKIHKFPLIVKAQIHAGGRGKAGGVVQVNSTEELKDIATQLLGKRLVTKQTGEEGRPVNGLLIEEVLDIAEEIYVGIIIDRIEACPVILASREGGMEIEKVAVENPDKVIVEKINPAVGLRPFQTNKIFSDLRLSQPVAKIMNALIMNLYRLFVEKDCSLVEINPLVITKGNEIVALDAKATFDDNALYRHPEVLALRDISQENPLEVEANRFNLNYIKLKGTVGCMVNGAGLAMATMDLIKLAGAEPANFLDVGGGASVAMVKEGLKILLSDNDVKVILINIFGGILRCDTLARGVVEAAHEVRKNIPVVIRLEGTNVDAGRKILAESSLTFTVAGDMKDAAEKVKALLN